MASTTVASPISHGASESTWGHSYAFAPTILDEAMSDSLDVLGLGIARLLGDFAGSGTDTLRVRYIDGVAWERPMSAMGSETDRIAPSPVTLGYSEVSLGQYGLGYSDTYKAQLLSMTGAELVDALLATIPASWAATVRSLVCTAGSTISAGTIGSNTLPLTIDDWLDLIAARRTTTGAIFKGRPVCMLAGIQINQLVESARQEPAFAASAAAFAMNSQATDGALHPNLFGLGLDVAETNDVVVSSSARQGFAISPGGIGYGIGNTSRIRAAGINPIIVPDRGLLVEMLTEGAAQSIREASAKAFLGVALGDSNVFFQRVVRSINS